LSDLTEYRVVDNIITGCVVTSSENSLTRNLHECAVNSLLPIIPLRTWLVALGGSVSSV